MAPVSPVREAASAAPPSPALLNAIAEQMALLAEQSERFGMVLCSDPDVAGRYLVELQQIDRLAQSLREMALVLTSTNAAAAVGAIRLGDLRQSLEAAPIH